MKFTWPALELKSTTYTFGNHNVVPSDSKLNFELTIQIRKNWVRTSICRVCGETVTKHRDWVHDGWLTSRDYDHEPVPSRTSYRKRW